MYICCVCVCIYTQIYLNIYLCIHISHTYIHICIYLYIWMMPTETFQQVEPTAHPHLDMVSWLFLHTTRWRNRYILCRFLPCHCWVQSPVPFWELKNSTFWLRAEERWSLLMCLLIKKQRGSEAFTIDFCLWMSRHFHLLVIKGSAQRKEEDSFCVWQTPRQSWIIYLFCNSFLSNIPFLSLVIKNWNASFSVDDLTLTICLSDLGQII